MDSKKIIAVFAVCCLTLAVSADAQDASNSQKPNVILILCDNLGYGDIEVYNPEAKQPTPRLNRLAAEGMTFTHAYACAPVCTPSRAALMTGCYPRRVGLDLPDPKAPPVLRPVSRFGLHPAEITIAEILKSQGYRTLCIGKWHLGDQPPFLPTRQGFDEFFGIPYSDDMVENRQRGWPPLPLIDGETVVEAPAEVNNMTQRNTERALRFIEENLNRPFFLFFSQITPGSTTSPPVSEAFRGKSENGSWGDSVMELDWSTGEIVDKLAELEIARNTLIVWTNDNGAPATASRGGSNLPLRGDAYNVSEGGMRTPFIARWPGKISAATKCAEMVTLMDVLPAVASLAGGKVPDDRKIDGHDITPLLFGTEGAKTPYRAFYYYYVDQLQAVRSGSWKLYLPSDRRKMTFGGQTRKVKGELYDLVADPREQHNRFADRPEIVSRLMELAKEAREDLGDMKQEGKNVRPKGVYQNPSPCILLPAANP